MRKGLIRTAFLTLGLTLITNTGNTSWAGQYIEREKCVKDAALFNPRPQGCANAMRKVIKTAFGYNRQRQPSCKIESVIYDVCLSTAGTLTRDVPDTNYTPLDAKGQQAVKQDGLTPGQRTMTRRKPKVQVVQPFGTTPNNTGAPRPPVPINTPGTSGQPGGFGSTGAPGDANSPFDFRNTRQRGKHKP